MLPLFFGIHTDPSWVMTMTTIPTFRNHVPQVTQSCRGEYTTTHGAPKCVGSIGHHPESEVETQLTNLFPISRTLQGGLQLGPRDQITAPMISSGVELHRQPRFDASSISNPSPDVHPMFTLFTCNLCMDSRLSHLKSRSKHCVCWHFPVTIEAIQDWQTGIGNKATIF